MKEEVKSMRSQVTVYQDLETNPIMSRSLLQRELVGVPCHTSHRCVSFPFSEAVPLSWNLHLACTWIGRGTREPWYKTSCESLYNTFCNPHRAEEAVTLALASAGRAYLAWPTRGNVPPNRLSRANLCDSTLGNAQRHGRLRPVFAGTAR